MQLPPLTDIGDSGALPGPQVPVGTRSISQLLPGNPRDWNLDSNREQDIIKEAREAIAAAGLGCDVAPPASIPAPELPRIQAKLAHELPGPAVDPGLEEALRAIGASGIKELPKS